MSKLNGSIELSLPFKAEYVSIARLTVSGISNCIGFDIDTIEDIKVAVAEVCNKLVKMGSGKSESFKIIFQIYEDKLISIFDCDDKSLKCIFDNEEDELGISIINALMDSVELSTDNNYLFSITKVLEGNN